MTVRSVFGRSLRWMLTTPLLWLYGLLAVLLGWQGLQVTLIANAIRAPDTLIERGTAGALGLAVLASIALLVEVMTIRALAAAPIAPSIARVPRVVGFYVAMGLAALLIAIAVVFSLTWIFSTVAGFIINFLTFDLGALVALALMGLSLVLPLWALTPLGERAAALSDGGVWDAVFASLSLFEEAAGPAFVALVTTLALDLLVFALGAWLNARDVSAPALLGIIAMWPGGSLVAGAVLLLFGVPVAMFKLAVWTAIYVEVAPRVRDELTITQGARPHPAPARRWLTVIAAQSRRAITSLARAPVLLIFAGLIAFIGLPGPADLLTLYRLVPTPDQSPNLRVFFGLLPDGGVLLVLLYPVALILTTMLSAALIVGTRDALGGQPVRGLNAVSEGLARWWVLLLTKISLAISGGIVGMILMVGGLFALALIVAIAPGFDPLGTYWTTLTAVLAVLGVLLFLPVVARVVMFEEVRGSDAVLRSIDVLFGRPLLALFLFVFTFGLDVVKGPIATLAGLLTNGWADMLAVLVGRRLDAPIGLGTWLGSIGLFVVATVVIAFKALLWTEFYGHAATRAETDAEHAETVEADAAGAPLTKPRAKRRRPAPSP